MSLNKKNSLMDVLKLVVIEKEFKERIKWLIHLRWLAGIGVFMVITFSRAFITEGLPWIKANTGLVAEKMCQAAKFC